MIHESIDVVATATRILAMSLGAGTVGAGTAFVYRWYSGTSIPEGVPILLGVSVVATALNTTATLQKSLAADELVGGSAAGYTIAAFVAGAIAADAGRRLGERLGSDLPSVDSVRTMESDVGSLVRAAGRVIRVRVPETIEDIDGYEPVLPETKTELAGTTFLFPRRMTVGELHDRVVERLKRDYEVGHVDLELAADGSIEYLALGRRLAGVGQTLAPGTVAVAIHADPALTATPGDRVQIWQTSPGSAGTGSVDEASESSSTGSSNDNTGSGERPQTAEPQRVTTAELRAAVDDVATVAVDESEVALLEDGERYRLVTLPAAVQPDREFASLLRSADETMGSIEIEAGSELEGRSVDAVELTVAALESDGDVAAIPPHDRTLRAGDTVYVIGRPEGIRRVESSGKANAAGTDGGTSERGGSDESGERPQAPTSSATPTDIDD